MRVLSVLVLALTVCFVSAKAGEGEGGGRGGHRPPPGVIIQFALAHADDLGLTADQKTKLQDLAKNPPAPPAADAPKDGAHKGPLGDILTDDQRKKLRELFKAEHPGKGGDKGNETK